MLSGQSCSAYLKLQVVSKKDQPIRNYGWLTFLISNIREEIRHVVKVSYEVRYLIKYMKKYLRRYYWHIGKNDLSTVYS